MDLTKYKENKKTNYLCSEFERILREEEKTQKMLETDSAMKELVEEELEGLASPKQQFWIRWIRL